MTQSSAAGHGFISEAEIDRRFDYHPPSPEQKARYERITAETKKLAKLYVELTPAGREQSLAITKLEDARMRASQAIATGE